MYKIGIDEAGRGPWLGPVVACSVALNYKNKNLKKILPLIKDSKKITQKKRELLFQQLIKLSIGQKPSLFFGVGVVDNFLIDEINIKNANKEAMRRSLLEIFRKIDKNKVKEINIDGNDKYIFEGIDLQINYIIKGDEKIKEISTASIIAKVFRDKLIHTYSLLYPNFSLEKHKGYGTKKHIDYLDGINKITGIHRLSYQPIKNIIKKDEKNL